MVFLGLVLVACANQGGWTQEKADATNKLWLSALQHTNNGEYAQARSDTDADIGLLKPGTEEYYSHWQGFLSYSKYKELEALTYLAEDDGGAAKAALFESVHAMQDGQTKINEYLQQQHDNAEVAMFFVTTLTSTAIAAARPAAYRANPAAFQNFIHLPDFSAITEKAYITRASIDDDGVRMPSVHREGFLSAVGRLIMPGGWCTASMVGERLIATAAHCVTDEKTGAKRPGPIIFRLARYDQASGSELKQDIAVEQTFTHRGDGTWDRRRETDWALGVLAEKPDILMSYAYLGFIDDQADAAKEIATSKIAVVGYSSDLNDGELLTLDWDCSAGGIDKRGMLLEHCAAWKGSSGGPVILVKSVMKEHGMTGTLIGIHTYGSLPNGSRQNDTATLSSQFAALLHELRDRYP
jgi:V8-like Glu-specific endopeptidase